MHPTPYITALSLLLPGLTFPTEVLTNRILSHVAFWGNLARTYLLHVLWYLLTRSLCDVASLLLFIYLA